MLSWNVPMVAVFLVFFRRLLRLWLHPYVHVMVIERYIDSADWSVSSMLSA